MAQENVRAMAIDASERATLVMSLAGVIARQDHLIQELIVMNDALATKISEMSAMIPKDSPTPSQNQG